MASEQGRLPELAVCGLGASTPVGRTAWASAAAARAGLTGFTEHAFMVDSVGAPMRVATCPWLADEPDVVRRMTACLVDAVREALAPLAQAEATDPAARPTLLVALPPQRPGLEPGLVARVEDGLQAAFGNTFARIVPVRRGHAAGLLALSAVAKALERAPDEAFIVAGTDSWLDPDTLEWLEETDQLHGAGPKNNAWGFIPGEGAGALLLLGAGSAARLGLTPLAQVVGLGTGTETRLIRSGEVCLGQGLTDAMRTALAALPGGRPVTDICCDMNGDPYRADEYGFTVTRTRERFVSPSEFVAPADCWGDTGAASAPLAAVLSTIAMHKAYSNGQVSLLWASSDAGERGAAVLVAPPRPGLA